MGLLPKKETLALFIPREPYLPSPRREKGGIRVRSQRSVHFQCNAGNPRGGGGGGLRRCRGLHPYDTARPNDDVMHRLLRGDNDDDEDNV